MHDGVTLGKISKRLPWISGQLLHLTAFVRSVLLSVTNKTSFVFLNLIYKINGTFFKQNLQFQGLIGIYLDFEPEHILRRLSFLQVQGFKVVHSLSPVQGMGGKQQDHQCKKKEKKLYNVAENTEREVS